MPVAFGWHPYLRLPGVRRSALRVELPARRHLDARRPRHPHRGRLSGCRPRPRRWAVAPSTTSTRSGATGDWPRRRPTTPSALLFDRNYGYLQVYAPPDQNVCCLEPMTAPTNALSTGVCPFVSPGQSFTARFSVAVS